MSLFDGMVDHLFYNVGALRSEDKLRKDLQVGPDGTILIVRPDRKDSSEKIACIPFPIDAANWNKLCPNSHESALSEFLGRAEDTIRDLGISVICVAGVGSSAVGTAAFTFEVARAIKQPVAAVVTGDGMTDVLYTAWTGSNLADIDYITHHALSANVVDLSGALYDYAANDEGIVVLGLLLKRLSGKITCLIGHSRGSYVIHQAAHQLKNSITDEKQQKLLIVTMSAVADFNGDFVEARQFIGALDWFGAMNSVGDMKMAVQIPGAWHWTNPERMTALRVPDVLGKVGLLPNDGEGQNDDLAQKL